MNNSTNQQLKPVPVRIGVEHAWLIKKKCGNSVYGTPTSQFGLQKKASSHSSSLINISSGRFSKAFLLETSVPHYWSLGSWLSHWCEVLICQTRGILCHTCCVVCTASDRPKEPSAIQIAFTYVGCPWNQKLCWRLERKLPVMYK